MKIAIFLVFLAIRLSCGVIYRMNDTEYAKMPPIYYLDDYDSCLRLPNGTYCYVELDLVSDTPSDLLHTIQEYSEHTSTHFNHSHLHYGICLTKTCKYYLQENQTVDRRLILERCLNESLWRDYKLRAKLQSSASCRKLDDPININAGDIIAALFFMCLLLLNVIGSLYDFYYVKGGEGNNLLLSFSFKRNWTKLVSQDNQDPYKERLKGIHGLRTLSIMLVILAHSPLPFIIIAVNSHDIEKTYDHVVYHLFYNGTLIVQTFFLITGCLIAFNIRTYAEKNSLTWILIPKGIMMRWLRLTPLHAVVLIFTLTWLRYVGSGPLWETLVNVEVEDCQRYGWLNMIYLNNYFDHSQCITQTWYLASDMQLYILGLFVCILAKTDRNRNIVMSALFVIGLITPAIHTYLQDLDALVLVSPELPRNFLVNPTFNHSYKRGHTNISGFVLGLVLGNLIYTGFKDESKVRKYKKLGLLYHFTVPIGVVFVLAGMVFYGDRPRPSIYLRTVLASLVRPLFALLVTIFFIGMVFKFENLYRRILEWRGWRVPSRVSYSAYLIHVSIIRIFGGMTTTLKQIALIQCFKEAFGIIFITFLIAYPVWLFIEAPLSQVALIVVGFKKMKNIDKNKKQGSVKINMKQKTVRELESGNPEEVEEVINNIRL